MNYDEAINYIHSIPKFIRPLGNENLGGLLGALKNPQKNQKIIHIAGTNGKGSTAAMIASVLKEAGYKTGLFTSPFIEVFNERIRINGENIKDDELAEITERVKLAMEESGFGVSEFAFITAAAFLYFKEKSCDFIVLETGMGGRYDATNVIEKPFVSVLTAIGYDHMQYLGTTIEEIAEEKCGIIKNGCETVSQPNETVKEIIKNAAKAKNSALVFSENAEKTDGGFIYKGKFYELSLEGDYQAKNAACVLEAVNALRRNGVEIPENDLIKGLKSVKWAARFERITPNIIIDGGHNIDGIRALKKSLRKLGGQYIIVTAMMSDKQTEECIREISDGAEKVIATQIPVSRCETAQKLSEYAKNLICETDYKKAINKGISLAKEDKVLCICGSLYFAAEARKYLRTVKIFAKHKKM